MESVILEDQTAMADACQDILARAASIPAHLAFQWTKLPLIAATMEQRHVNSLRRNLCITSPLPNETAVVEGLQKHGVFVSDLEALGLSDDGPDGIMAAGREIAAQVEERATRLGRNAPAMITSNPIDLMRRPAIFRWGLNAVLLRIAEAYLRQPVAYDGPQVFHIAADGREVGTRRWHLDREDRQVIKIGLYLNDVGESGGPFQLWQHQRKQARRGFDYRALKTAELSQHLRDPTDLGTIITCTGKATSLIFADTARFYHRGKPATAQARAAIFFGYFGRPPRHPFFCGRSQLSRPQIARLVEGLHISQKICALWRDELPWYARLIPASRK